MAAAEACAFWVGIDQLADGVWPQLKLEHFGWGACDCGYTEHVSCLDCPFPKVNDE